MGGMPITTHPDYPFFAVAGIVTGILAIIVGVLVAKRRIRFGVRTLLITTTLLALLLGLINWLNYH